MQCVSSLKVINIAYHDSNVHQLSYEEQFFAAVWRQWMSMSSLLRGH